MSITKIRMLLAAAVAGASLVLAGATSAVAAYPAAAAVTSPVLGHWAPAAPVPGMPALTSTSSKVSAVSCAPSADCAIGGTYDDTLGNPQAWVASGHAGTWSNAIALPGSITTGGGHSEINAVSCATGNYCVAVGETSTDQFSDRATLAVDLGGTWQQAMILPGVGTSSSQALSVSCPSPGNCAARGFYTDASGNGQVFTTDEVNGVWGSAAMLPGQSSQGHFSTQSHVSCWSAGNCVTGVVVATTTGLQAIVSVESPAALAANTATVKFGQEQSAQLAIKVKPETGGTPAGQVTVSAGQTTLAVVTLKRGKATWTFPPKKLRPGTYQLTATYASSNGYDPVTSAKKKFVVTK